MKTIPIILLLLLIPFVSMAQDSLQSVSSVPVDTIHSSKVIKGNISKNKIRLPQIHKKTDFCVKPDITLSRIMSKDSVILSKINELEVGINNFVAKTSSLDMTSVKKQNEQLQSLLVMIRISVCLLIAVLIILVVFFALAILLYSKRRKRICTEDKSELKEIFNGLTSDLNDIIARQSNELKDCIVGQTSELKECAIGKTNAEEQIGEPLLQPTEKECVAYNDAVQAFVNINNYIYDLKQYNPLITPYILWFANENVEQPHVDISSVSEEERSKIALLVSKIGQFKQNHVQAINRYLFRTKKGENYTTCLRCPIKGHFDPVLDQHLLGDDLEYGEKIHSVYKIGFLFPNSKAFPYREKSLII